MNFENADLLPDRGGRGEGRDSRSERSIGIIFSRRVIRADFHSPFIPIDFRKSVFAQSWDNNDCATEWRGRKEYRLTESLPGWIIGKNKIGVRTIIFVVETIEQRGKNYNNLHRFFPLAPRFSFRLRSFSRNRINNSRGSFLSKSTFELSPVQFLNFSR